MINLILGDCLDKLKDIPKGSIDLVVIDPPYNVNYGYNQYKDNLSFSDYLSWQLEIIEECERVLKENGSLFYLNYPEFNSYIFCNLETNFSLKPIEIITWIYNTHNGGNPLRKSSRTWIWASKGKPLNLFKGEYKNPTDKRVKKLIEQGKNPKSYDWWEYQQVKNVSLEKTNHPCQVPEKMIEKIIQGTTNEGDTVLDCFLGSGTTGVACVNTNRQFIGIEVDPKYFNTASDRIESVNKPIL